MDKDVPGRADRHEYALAARQWRPLARSYQSVSFCEARFNIITGEMAILTQIIGQRWFISFQPILFIPRNSGILSVFFVGEDNMPMRTHSLNLSNKDHMVATWIFGDDTCIEKGQGAVNNGRTSSSSVKARVTKMLIALLGYSFDVVS